MASLPTVSRTERPLGRSFLLDLLKAVGCVLIVLHHLAFYGPMSDVVAQRWPDLMDWFADHGRLAVQFFLVCSGYLAAAGFARQPDMDTPHMGRLVCKRYLRLVLPLLAALSVTVLVTEGVRPFFDHPSLSSTPNWLQVIAHILLLQHLLDMEALSAGVWYVAIDFQLYLMTLLALWAVSLWCRWRPGWRADALLLQVFLALTLLSLVRWNLNSELDLYGLYFFGAYGMGWLAWRTRQSHIPRRGWAALLALGLLAWWVDPRLRVMTAWAVAMLLASAPATWLHPHNGKGWWRSGIHRLAAISYSVFLIHFAVGLAVSAWITFWWPQSLLWNALGMGLALGMSILAGAVLYRLTERKGHDGRHWLFWTAVFMASAALTMHWRGAALQV